MRIAVQLMLIALLTPCFGQDTQTNGPTKSPNSNATHGAALSDLTTKYLTFEKGDPLTAVAAAALISLPIHCTKGNSLLLDTINPQNPIQHSYIMLSPDNHVYYSPASIPGLTNVQVWDTFPTESEVAFLVKGTEPAAIISQGDAYVARGSDNSAQKPTSFYIALFTETGAFKQLIKLRTAYQLYHVAVLENGDFTVIGYDNVNDVPRLLLLKDTGELIKTISLPKSIQQHNAKNDKSEDYASVAAAENIGSIQFTASGHEVLAWRSHKKDPIISISADGSAREVRIAYPDGYVLSAIVSSTTGWILHLEPQDMASNSSSTPRAHNMNSFVYVEANPTDGDIISTIQINGDYPKTIACEYNGVFTSLQTDPNNTRMWLLRAQ